MNYEKSFLLACCTFAAVAYVYGQDFITIIHEDLILDVSDFELPWSDALEACSARNTSLLSVDSAEKDKILVDLFIKGQANASLPGNNSWIAATEYREGAWVWKPDDEPLYYSRWMIGQPDDLNSTNCAYQAVQALLYWRDANCSAPMYFICESPAPHFEPSGTTPTHCASFMLILLTFAAALIFV